MKRTVLEPLHSARGARWMEYQGWEIPASYSDVAQEYQALQEGVALIDLSYRGKLRITGRDRRSWLHGQVTQDINGLPDWRGTHATIITPQGRMVTDLRVFALPEALLVDLPPHTDTPIGEYLDRYLIMERAEIEDLTDSWALLGLRGPQSCKALATLFGEELLALEPWEIRAESFDSVTLYVARVFDCGEDGYDLFVPAARAAALWAALCVHRPRLAEHAAGWEALNIRRVEAGIPWWGHELDTTVVPLEARLDHTIHLHKGCYVGQEIIARIHARGHVNNLLAGFLIQSGVGLDADSEIDTAVDGASAAGLPPPGTEIHHDGKKVGRITSAVYSLRLGRPIALGYLRRELQEPGTRVQAVTAGGPLELEVASLPFVPNDYPPR